MKVVRYEPGDQPPHDVDCIKIERRADDAWSLSGSALVDDISVAFKEQAAYDSRDAAEAAGIAWAESRGVEELHLEVVGG